MLTLQTLYVYYHTTFCQIEQLSSEHHSLLLSLDNAGGTDDITDVGGHSLLLKIAVSQSCCVIHVGTGIERRNSYFSITRLF